MPGKAEDYAAFLTREMVHEGAVIIKPHPEPFRSKERSFLDGIKTVPAAISGPPGKDPFGLVFSRPGHWLFIWLPD